MEEWRSGRVEEKEEGGKKKDEIREKRIARKIKRGKCYVIQSFPVWKSFAIFAALS